MENILLLSHNIDLETGKIEGKSLDGEDAIKYFNDLISEILEKENKKSFKIIRDSTEVVSIVRQTFADQHMEESKDAIPNRLLEKEIKAQETVDKLKIKIKKGSLVQAFVKKDSDYYFLITKIEADDFLASADYKKIEGLPFSKKVLKSCVFHLNENGDIMNIFLADSNGNIATYWYKEFLELEEETTDEQNTKNMFAAFDAILKNELKDKAPADYVVCRNSTLSYFKTQESFAISDAFDYIFGGYSFENESIRRETIEGKINKKIEKKSMDTSFSLKPGSITAKKIKEIKKVNDFISLEINGFDEELKNKIFSKKEGEDKYIILKTTEDKTFDAFNWN